MEIRQLRHFVAAAEAGNLRKASESMNITHPALSMSIKNLETNLGVKLLDKGRSGVEMTYAGQQFLKSAHSLLRQIDDLQASMKGNEDSPTGKVRLGIPYGLNNSLAAPFFKILSEKFPGIDLEIEEGNTTSLGKLYESGSIDLMINYDVVEKMDRKCEPLYEEKLYFVSAYDPVLKDIEEMDLKDLSDLPIVCSPGTNAMRTTLERYAFEHKVRFNFLPDFQSAHASIKIAEAGLANTISPWDEVQDQVSAKMVTARRIENPSINRTICLISSLRGMPSRAVGIVVGVIKEAMELARKEDRLRGEPVVDKV